jgi:uncharacterized protein (DUF433 family)
MTLVIEREAPPWQQDATGAVRVGTSRVLLELVIRAFQDGVSAEAIVQRYSTLLLSDVYRTIGYYLHHREAVDVYLQRREQLAAEVQQQLGEVQPDLGQIRDRLLARQGEIC